MPHYAAFHLGLNRLYMWPFGGTPVSKGLYMVVFHFG